MSSWSLQVEPPLGEPITCENELILIIQDAISHKSNTLIQIEAILQSPNGEGWAHNVMLYMIHNLSFDESIFWQFGTPDRDIKNAVIQSGKWKNIWVKLLGIKMRALIVQLDNLNLSSIHKDRIRQLDQEFKKIFPARLPESDNPYGTIL